MRGDEPGRDASESVTIKKDSSPPAIKWSSPPPNAGYYFGESIPAEFSCTDAVRGWMSAPAPWPMAS
jgi:hypothetical protein